MIFNIITIFLIGVLTSIVIKLSIRLNKVENRLNVLFNNRVNSLETKIRRLNSIHREKINNVIKKERSEIPEDQWGIEHILIEDFLIESKSKTPPAVPADYDAKSK